MSPSSQPLVGNANVRKIDFDDRRCFRCNKVGHLQSHCPQIQETRRNPQPQGVSSYKIRDQGHLNSKGVPRRGVARNEPWIAPFKPVGPAPRSK